MSHTFKVGDLVTVRDFEAVATAPNNPDFLRRHVHAGTYRIDVVWDDGDVCLTSVPDTGGSRPVSKGSLVEAALVPKFKPGDKVRIKQGAKSYLGTPATEEILEVKNPAYTSGPGTSYLRTTTSRNAGNNWHEADAELVVEQEQPQEDTHASLRRVFDLAVAQTQSGKGADRHGNGEAFEDQLIVTMNRELGTNHGALFQAKKKVNESARLAATNRKDMAKAELLGAMVYLGAAYLLLEAE